MTPTKLLQKLTSEGGAIVLSDQCSEIEIADAQCTGRFAVNQDGIGYVLRYPEWLSRHKTCLATIKGIQDALHDISEMPEIDQDDAHRLRHKAKFALSSLTPAASTGDKQ